MKRKYKQTSSWLWKDGYIYEYTRRVSSVSYLICTYIGTTRTYHGKYVFVNTLSHVVGVHDDIRTEGNQNVLVLV